MNSAAGDRLGPPDCAPTLFSFYYYTTTVDLGAGAIDGFLAEGLEDGVLFDEVEVLTFEVVGKGAVCDGVVAFEGTTGGAGEADFII